MRAALAGLDAAVTVAELERTIIAAEAEVGLNIPNARRALSSVEFAAGVRFGDMYQRMMLAGERLANVTAPVVDLLSGWLLDRLRSASKGEAVALLTGMLSPAAPLPVPGLSEAMAVATREGVAVLSAVWRESAEDVKAEAVRQGGNAPASTETPDDDTRAVMTAAVETVIVQAMTRLLQVALEAARRAP